MTQRKKRRCSGLNKYNYFSKNNQFKYMGVSQFKAFENCQSAAMAELNGTYKRPKTTSLLVGSYIDAHFEGTLDIFKAQHPELFKKDGTLKAEYIQAEAIINRIERDEMFMHFMNGKKQVIFTGEIKDVPIKIKVDSMHDDKIVDLKIMKDFEPMYVQGEGRQSFIEAWKYDLQGAIYQEIVYQNTGKRLPFYIAAATKEPVTDIGIFEVPQELMDYELSKFKEKIVFYDGVKKGVFVPDRCEKCGYCKETKVLTDVTKLEEMLDE